MWFNRVFRKLLGCFATVKFTKKQLLGAAGERAAARYLKARGYRVLGRNLRVPMGEADLLCEAPDGRTIVLVEVKTRNAREESSWEPPPEAAVDTEKRQTLTSILRYLARKNRWHGRPLRIDVVGIDWPRDGEGDKHPPVIRHHIRTVMRFPRR